MGTCCAKRRHSRAPQFDGPVEARAFLIDQLHLQGLEPEYLVPEEQIQAGVQAMAVAGFYLLEHHEEDAPIGPSPGMLR